jgi:hypothetical protein
MTNTDHRTARERHQHRHTRPNTRQKNDDTAAAPNMHGTQPPAPTTSGLNIHYFRGK